MDASVTQMEYDVPFNAGFMYWCMCLNVCCWQLGVFVPAQRLPVACNRSIVWILYAPWQ